MLRSVLSVLAGVVAGGILIAVFQAVGHTVYPPPPDIHEHLHDRAAMAEILKTLPAGAFIAVLLAWALGAFGGGGLAACLAGRSRLGHAAVVGGVLMLLGILTMTMIPHPRWFWFAGIVVFIPAAVAGGRLLGGSPASSREQQTT